VNSRGVVGLVIFVLFVLLAVVVLLLVIYLRGRDEPAVVSENVSLVNITFFNFTVETNADSVVHYGVFNESGLLQQGVLFFGAVERVDGLVVENHSVVVKAFGEGYYFNQTLCNVTYDGFVCRVGLKPKAHGVIIDVYSDALIVDPKGGVLQAPIMFCWQEKANVQNILMNLSLIEIPLELKKNYDFCYQYNEDIVNKTSLLIDIHKNVFNNVTDVLTVLVRDVERDGYVGVGDRTAVVLI
jgi:hypothetical protein